jgi:hypothetical protein
MMLPPGLRGSYHPWTDSLRFNRRIPDSFPFISYKVSRADQVSPLAVLVEEFLHRCQWAATPFGLVFRATCLVQAREAVHILRLLAEDPGLRLPTPWLEGPESANVEVARSMRTIRSLDVLQRFLLGLPLGHRTTGLAGSVDDSREALIRSSPLSLGTFRSWDAEEVAYRADGTPIHNRTTRAILESHASAFAVELIRSFSDGASRWLDEHVSGNRVGLYRALEELAAVADSAVPALGPRHILDLADISISVQLAEIYGFPPPPDYLDSMLPYVRYSTALSDVSEMARAFELIVKHEPEKAASVSDAQRVDLIVEGAARLRGQASLVFNLSRVSKRPAMERNIAATWQWDGEEHGRLDSTGEVRVLESLLIDQLSYSSIRFFKIHAEMDTGSTIFEPTVERFVMLARACDWPVIEYDDGPVVFFCDPMQDPGPVARGQIALFELTRAVRALLTQPCAAFEDPYWRLTLWDAPLIDLFGVRRDQLHSTGR